MLQKNQNSDSVRQLRSGSDADSLMLENAVARCLQPLPATPHAPFTPSSFTPSAMQKCVEKPCLSQADLGRQISRISEYFSETGTYDSACSVLTDQMPRLDKSQKQKRDSYAIDGLKPISQTSLGNPPGAVWAALVVQKAVTT